MLLAGQSAGLGGGKKGKNLYCGKKGEHPIIVFVDMEIMRTFTSSLTKTCLLACLASSAIASDVILQKVPSDAVEQTRASSENPAGNHSTTFGLINYNLGEIRTKARARSTSVRARSDAGQQDDRQSDHHFVWLLS